MASRRSGSTSLWYTRPFGRIAPSTCAGDKCFVNYAGQKARVVDPSTDEIREVELFVAVLGASNYTYAEASGTQQIADWLGSHQQALTFFGGVPRAIVCDQLKSGVTVPCRCEPGVQRTYEEYVLALLMLCRSREGRTRRRTCLLVRHITWRGPPLVRAS